tara:strand:+ start:3624 stop:4268 length:645 start_codon:yes stop_codon:yes gene_type:complete
MSDENKIIYNEKNNINLKSIFLNNIKVSIISSLVLLIILFSYFFYIDYKKKAKVKISEEYNFAITEFDINNQNQSINLMKNLINIKDSTYSPLALYFLLDNNLLSNRAEINGYFDILINETELDKEIKNLIIYKKGLFNSNSASEEELLSIFKPLLNTENIWKSHSLYVIAEYFFAKNEKQKSKEFFEKILEQENSNTQIKIEAQKRLQRDFGV